MTRSILLLAGLALTTGCAHKNTNQLSDKDYLEVAAWYVESELDSVHKELQLNELESYIEEMNAVDESVASFYSDLFEEFEPALRSGRLSLTVSDGRLHLGLSDDVLFDSGSAELSDSGDDAVATLARVMKRHPDRRFQIEGHTDARPIDNAEYDSNWELGADRAISVVEELVSDGVLPGRLSAASYAQYDPVASNQSDTGRQYNRRIDVVIVPDLNEMEAREQLVMASNR